MVATKQILINNINVGYGTNAKVSPSSETKETKTFDGPVIDGTDESSYKIEIEKLRYDTIAQYTELTQLLLNMEEVGYTIRIWEQVQMKDGLMAREDVVYECKLSSNEYELKPDERTVEKLSFTGYKRKIYINGKAVKKTV